MKILKSWLLAAVMVLPMTLVNAPSDAADNFTLDKAHTQISFSILRLGFSNISGWFRKFDGNVMFDPDNVANSSVKATVMASSIDSGHERRDNHLRSPDFFNAKEFPEITFVSTKVEKTGAKTGKMTGNLTMLGVTRPVTLDVTFNRMGVHPRNNKTYAGFSATGMLDRTAFGMKFLAPAVSPKVMIRIEALSEKK
jgi:polyisoprenoid-binding protein YceI